MIAIWTKAGLKFVAWRHYCVPKQLSLPFTEDAAIASNATETSFGIGDLNNCLKVKLYKNEVSQH